jgi:arginyl-tRNA synthetase
LIRKRLIGKLSEVLNTLVSNGVLPNASYPALELSEPKQAGHGDFACTFALAAAKPAGLPPRAIAEAFAAQLGEDDDIEAVEVAGPGFLNLTLSPAFVASFLPGVLASETLSATKDAAHYAHVAVDQPHRINVEFVSVNPNGPITIGSGRGAAYGSTLCNVLEAAGNGVHREYYINDGVSSEQMRLFATSVKAIVGGLPVPDNGYKGDYVRVLAAEMLELFRSGLTTHVSFIEARADQEDLPAHARLSARRLAAATRRAHDLIQSSTPEEALLNLPIEDLRILTELLMTEAQSSALRTFGVVYDTWYGEQSLHDSGLVAEEIEELIAKGAADTNPIRAKLKLARGGVIEDVEIEPQTKPVDDEGNVIETDEAESDTLWLRSTKFADDMDRVLRRRDGRLTYIASDVSYHKDKFNRPENGDRLITVLGPDHHGYIGRLTAVVAAMLASTEQTEDASSPELTEIDAKLYSSKAERDTCLRALAEAREKLTVQIYQLVRFMKDGKPAPMRKRDGNIYALIDLINEIGEKVKPTGSREEKQEAGKDVARFFYLMRHHDSTFDFDLDLAEKQSDDNPVFYVQYAHARICSVLAKAAAAGFASPSPEITGGGQGGEVDSTTPSSDAATLEMHPREKTLLLKILELPNEIDRCAEDYAVNRLATYAIELARTYHHFYDACRVIQADQPELTRRRIAYSQAARIALRTVLDLLGVSAPERMDREPVA